MKRSDLTYRAVQGLAGWACSGLLIVGGWAVLDAVTWHFGRPVAYFVAICAAVISFAVWLDELVPPERGGGDADRS